VLPVLGMWWLAKHRPVSTGGSGTNAASGADAA
jgi:hypothetical protein